MRSEDFDLKEYNQMISDVESMTIAEMFSVLGDLNEHLDVLGSCGIESLLYIIRKNGFVENGCVMIKIPKHLRFPGKSKYLQITKRNEK